jgi:hypothetical protein
VTTKIIAHIYAKKYKKYYKIQAQPKHTKFSQVQAQRNKKFNPITYTKTLGVMLMWKDFEDFHKFIAYVKSLWEHALANFPTLIHFLSSWVEFRKSKGIFIFGPNFESPTPWKLGQGWEKDTKHAP